MSIAAVALMAALTSAPAQNESPRPEARSEIHIVSANGNGPGRMDANGDGVVTREEFTAPMGNAFDRLDANRDGRLSTEEMSVGHDGPDGGPRTVFTMGGPGRPEGPGVSGVQVFTSRMAAPGGPGIPAGREVRIIRRDGGPGGDGPPVIIHGEGGPGGNAEVFSFRTGDPEGGPGGHQVFVRRFGGPDGPDTMDKDGDGRVSQDEFLAPMRDAFGRMDADGDGFLDDRESMPPPPSPAR